MPHPPWSTTGFLLGVGGHPGVSCLGLGLSDSENGTLAIAHPYYIPARQPMVAAMPSPSESARRDSGSAYHNTSSSLSCWFGPKDTSESMLLSPWSRERNCRITHGPRLRTWQKSNTLKSECYKAHTKSIWKCIQPTSRPTNVEMRLRDRQWLVQCQVVKSLKI